MIPSPYLPSATVIENHLWQSTIFAVVVWLLTLLLRNNRANVRYILWLAASIKFLIPFSFLIYLGSLLPHPHHIIAASQPILYSTVDAVTQPFSEVEIPAVTQHTSDLKERLTASLPLILAALWLAGAIAVLLIWYARWRQISTTLRRAVLTPDSRETHILHRLQTLPGQHTNITLRHSHQLTEPGIIGVFRPVLLWPAQLSDHLEDAHIEAILAHELTHARRHDNLAAVLHMLVEAVFWFHPIVWWIERRMIEERERACDESVVYLTGKPDLYAESLLKTCRFCVESPLACVSGITGADLNQRVRSIMTLRLKKLSAAGKFVLTAFGLVTLMGPVAFGLMHWIPQYSQILHATGSLPSFEVVSIRPWKRPSLPPPPPPANGAPAPPKIMKVDPSSGGERRQTSDQLHMVLPVQVLIESAYNLPFDTRRIIGGPDWMRGTDNDQYEIRAKIDGSQFTAMQKMTTAQQREQVALMEQSLLTDRFNLKLHFETREMPGFALVIVKGTPKLTPAKDGESSRLAEFDDSQASGLIATAVTLDQLVNSPLFLHGRPGVNQTGLKGAYDFTLKLKDKNDPTEPDSETSVFTAVQEQLGLKLVPTKTPVEVLVIDHIDPPSDNSTEPEPATTQKTALAPQTAVTTVAAPITSFEIISIRQSKPGSSVRNKFLPDGYSETGLPLKALISISYGIRQDLITGAPGWTESTQYDVEAKEDESLTAALQKLPIEQRDAQIRLMLQALLADRFHLRLSHVNKELPVYDLIVARSGFKLKETDPNNTYPNGTKGPDGTPRTILTSQGQVIGQAVSIPQLANNLSYQVGRSVADKTGLTGKYDFTLKWESDHETTNPTASGSSIFTALQEQLGLKLEPTKGPVETLVIDHVERPSEN